MKIVIGRRLFWYYRLVSPNGETLATSETYYSKGNAERAAGRLAEYLNIPVVENGK